MLDSLTQMMGSRLIKEPVASKGAWPARYETLENLASAGAEAWYRELRFSTRPGDAVDDIILELAGFRLEPIIYGFEVERFYRLKVRQLKMQANHEPRLNHVVFPAALFAPVADRLKAVPTIAALHRQSGAPRVRSQNGYLPTRLPHGRIRSRPGRHPAILRVRAVGPRSDACRSYRAAADYAPDSWPHRTVNLLASPSYKKGLCHLCISDRHGPETAALAYGDNLQHFEDVYIDQLMREGGYDRTARAEVQRRLGLSR